MKITLKVVIGLLLIVNSLSLFQTYPDVTFYSGTSSGTVIKMSPSEDKVAIGYTNGYVKIYDSRGYWIYSMYSHSSKIIDMQWSYSYGLITLDSTGKAIRWSDYGSQMYTWNLNGTVYDMSISDDTGYSYIAFNLGNRIEQYYLSGNLYQTYYPQNYSQFRRVQYSHDHYYLFVSTNTSYVQVYSCTTRNSIGYSMYTGNPIKAFSLMSDGYTVVGLNTNSVMYKLTSGGINFYLGPYISTNAMVVCPYTNLIAMAETNYYDIGIYDFNGNFQQYLTYMTGNGQALDCTNNHLVSVDYYGYVTINSYSSFPGWAIALISVGGCLIIVTVIVLVAVKRRRAKRAMQGFDQYGRIDNTVPATQPYFNNNQGFQPNPVYQPPSNQGFNNNPSFSNQPVNNNPYQANQPRNWN